MWTRREMLASCAAAVPALGSLAEPSAAANPRKERLGIVADSFANRRAAERARAGGFTDPRVFLDHCHALGAGGMQLDLGARDRSYSALLRAKVEEYQMYLEGSIRLPRDRADVERFAREVDTAREAGASGPHTVAAPGRVGVAMGWAGPASVRAARWGVARPETTSPTAPGGPRPCAESQSEGASRQGPLTR